MGQGSRVLFSALLILVFALGIFLRVAFLKDIDYSGSVPDEKFYHRYAAYMAVERQASIKVLVNDYIENAANHIFPSPIRAGYIMIASRWMQLLAQFNYQALSYMSALFSIMSLFAGYFFTKRLFGYNVALFSLVLFAFSPMNLAFSMRAQPESMLYFFIILTLWLFYEAFKREGIFLKIAFAASFFMTAMVKESSLLIILFFLVIIFWKKRFSLLVYLALSVAAVVMAYLIITGGVANLAKLSFIILTSPLTNRWAIEHLTGPITRYGFDFFLISPLTLLAATGFFILYFVDKAFWTESCAYLASFLVVYYLANSLYIKNVRYVIALDFPIRVFTVIFISAMLARLKLNRFAIIFTAIVLIACVDFFIFYRMYVHNPIFYDPITGNLIGCWEKFILKI